MSYGNSFSEYGIQGKGRSRYIFSNNGANGGTYLGISADFGYKIYLASPSWGHSTIEIGNPSKVLGTKATKGMGSVNARGTISFIEPFFCEN